MILTRVSSGLTTSSTYIFRADSKGPLKIFSYSATSLFLVASGSLDSWISLRQTTFTAPSAPMTASSAVGQASTRSVPMGLLHIACFPPP